MNPPTPAQLSYMAQTMGWTVARVKAAFSFTDWEDEDASLSQDQDILIVTMCGLLTPDTNP